MRSQFKPIHLFSATLMLSMTLPLLVAISLPTIAQSSEKKTETATNQTAIDQANQLLKQGDSQIENNQLAEALPLLQQALKIYRQEKNRVSEGHALKSIGNAYFILRRYKEAIDSQEQALSIAREIKDTDLEARTLSNIGNAYRDLKQTEQAISFYQRSLSVSRNSKNFTMIAVASGNLGIVYDDLKRYDDAIATIQEGVLAAQRISDRSKESALLALQGSAFYMAGKYDEAIAAYDKALLIGRKLGDKHKLPQLRVLISLMAVRNGISLNVLMKERKYQQVLVQANQVKQIISEAFALSKELANAGQDDIRANESMTYIVIGSAYTGLADFSKAEEFLLKALSIAQSARSIQTEKAANSGLRNLYTRKGEDYKLFPLIQRRIQIDQELKSPISTIYGFLSVGNQYMWSGEIQKAFATYQQALQQVENTSPTSIDKDLLAYFPKVKSSTYSALARTHLYMAQHDQALKIARQNLQFSESTPDPEIKVGALLQLGKIYAELQKFPDALDKFQQALEVSKKNNRADLEAEALIELSSIWLVQGNARKAIMFAQQAMLVIGNKKNDGFDDPFGYAQDRLFTQSKVREVLADAYASRGDYNKALEILRQGVEQENQLNDPQAQARGSLFKLANLYLSLGNYREATALFKQILIKTQSVKSPLDESIAWHLLSESARLQQQPQKALEFAQNGIRVAQQNQIIVFELLNQGSLSEAYGELWDEQKAMASAQTTLNLARQLRRPSSEKTALVRLAQLSYRFKRPDAALANYQAALSIQTSPLSSNTNENNAYIYAAIGKIYADRKQPATAIAFYKQAIHGIQTKRQKFQTLPTDLQKSFLQATVDFGGVKVSDIYRQLAELLLSQGQVLEAQQVLELLKIQEIREFDRTTRAAINRVGESLPLEGTEKEIIEKYGSYLNFIQQVRSCQTQTSKCSDSEIDRLMELRRKAQDEYDRSIQALNEELETKKKKDQENFLDPRNPLSAKAARLTEKRPDRAVIYSLVTDDRIWLIVATQGAPLRTFKIEVKRKELSDTVAEFRKAMGTCQQPGYTCTQADTQAVKQISQKLYRWLFPTELQKEIPSDKIKHLIFSLDRNIRYIPMSALFDGEKYLIEKYAISSITTADRPENEPFNRTAQDTSVLAMGASKFPSGESPLPNVEIEVNTIVKDLAKRDTHGIYPGLEFLNLKFTRRNLQNSLYGRNILHLASHGVFNLTTPHESYIALGDGDKLHIPEIRQILDLSTIDLVVLSACQTALGGRENEEGIEIASLGSAFLQNQAKSVLASLWNVDDISTSLLMQQVYQNLAKDSPRITRAEALQQAQRQFIEGKMTIADGKRLRQSITLSSPPNDPVPNQVADYKHPYYWSPFILMGSGF